ncbi:MAG TPA: ankyrin repeat domain-containing protein, partial [Gammaproteobacteria bacterium]|nr:ankyrin repeat domain-containing protein [Gammaproteobacteria bacterium]
MLLDSQNNSVLMIALKHFCEYATVLIDKCPPLGAIQDGNAVTPFRYALEKGYMKVLDLLLKNESQHQDDYITENELNSTDVDRWTYLHFAAQDGLEFFARFLLHAMKVFNEDRSEHKINLCEMEAVDGQTPLDLAVKYKEVAMIELLLQNGASLDTDQARQLYENIPDILHQAAMYNYELLMESLLSAGIDVDTRADKGCTALHIAAKHGYLSSVERLLDYHASASSYDDHQRSPIYYAHKIGCYEIILKLVEKGAQLTDAEITSHDGSGWSLLHYAALYNYSVLIKPLLLRGLKINEKKSDGWTPLHLAANNGNTEALAALIENGADVTALDEDKLSAADHAMQKKQFASAELLMKKGAPLSDASFAYRYENNHTVLHCAINERNEFLTGEVLSRDVDVNARTRDGKTPLHVAVIKDDHLAVDLLLKKKATVETKDDAKNTPIQYAIKARNTMMVDKLLKAGATLTDEELFIICDNNSTLLHAAARDNAEYVTKEYLRRKGDANRPAFDNETPLHIAASNGNLEVLD